MEAEVGGQLDGKVAVVTGAARGIGAATAHALAFNGARVVVSDIDREGAHGVADAIGDSAIAIAADVREEAAVHALIEATVKQFGRLDVLHNNAVVGLPEDTDTVNTPDDVWRSMFQMVVLAAVYGCRHAIPVMTATGGGSLIHTSSGAARSPSASKIAYGSAKGALEVMSMYTATMYAGQGIRSNVVAPGFVLTEGTKEILDPTMLEMLSSRSAAGRTCQPSDVADVVLFLASDASAYVNGQVITVNGGGNKAVAW
jgi:NAD(P)-dependent dehydrogenase (short-subunit alcohol dehydrogenase family)